MMPSGRPAVARRPAARAGPRRATSGEQAMSEKPRVVVVDDEADIRETVGDYLGLHGFEVLAAENGAALRALVETETLDLAILDINMPGEDGLSLARFLRESTDIGIVMLTASGETVDRIVGLEMGADDYLPKPFDLRELMARIKAVLRRRKAAGKISRISADGAETLVRFGSFLLNLDSHKLFDGAGEEVAITSMEYDLLKVFAEHPNRVLNRDQLLEYAHNRDWEPFDRSIDIRIMRLRRKIEEDPGKPQIIKTVRGVGYMFATR